MIEVSIKRALGDYDLGKNASFKEGALYFFRFSKCGLKLVVRSEEGYWIPLHPRYRWYTNTDGFKRELTIYMKNRKRLNEFSSVEEYLEGDNLKKSNWMWYDAYADVNLYF